MVKRIGRNVSVEQPDFGDKPDTASDAQYNSSIGMMESNDIHNSDPQNDNLTDKDEGMHDAEEHLEDGENLDDEEKIHDETDKTGIEEDEANVESINGAEASETSNPRMIPSYAKISTLFRKRDVQKLASHITAIDSQLPHEFLKYRDAVERKERLGDELISQVLHQNEKLKSRVIQLKTKIDSLRSESKKSLANTETELLKMTGNSEGGVYADKMKLNFLELLTGIKCDDFAEENDMYNFKIKQKGTNGLTHTYQLVIDKSDPANVTYHPAFNDKSDAVRGKLPEYLQDKLIFPTDSIRLLHQKIAQSLF